MGQPSIAGDLVLANRSILKSMSSPDNSKTPSTPNTAPAASRTASTPASPDMRPKVSTERIAAMRQTMHDRLNKDFRKT